MTESRNEGDRRISPVTGKPETDAERDARLAREAEQERQAQAGIAPDDAVRAE